MRGPALLLSIAMALTMSACGGDAPTADGGEVERLRERLAVVWAHVEEWRTADNLAEAQRAAEAAANHVVGPNGPGFGDRDGDGEVRGPTDAGILPGLAGTPPGFALAAATAGAPECVVRDVLGGSWSEPADRWAEMETAIAGWLPGFNTFPGLPSHAQRVVGWATLTLNAESLREAHGYAGHAQLHAAIGIQALDNCRTSGG